jgi:hypothetical protein
MWMFFDSQGGGGEVYRQKGRYEDAMSFSAQEYPSSNFDSLFLRTA